MLNAVVDVFINFHLDSHFQAHMFVKRSRTVREHVRKIVHEQACSYLHEHVRRIHKIAVTVREQVRKIEEENAVNLFAF